MKPKLTLAEKFNSRSLTSLERVHSRRQRLFRPAELDHTRLKVTERTFNKTSLLLVVGKEVKPKRMLNITKKKKKKSVPSLKIQYR